MQFAERYMTVAMPSATQNPKSFFKFVGKMYSPLKTHFLGLFALQVRLLIVFWDP